MDIVLGGLKSRSCLVYLDDILVFSSGTLDDHLEKLSEVMFRLKEHGLKAQPKKCQLCRSSFTYVGHVVDRNGFRPDPSLVERIENFPRPISRRQVNRFIGLVGYYRIYVERFAEMAQPLTKLLSQKVNFEWTEQQEKAFEQLKQKLMSRPCLAYLDMTKPFYVKPDWSEIALGAVLTQYDDKGREHPVAYLSRRRCHGREATYSSRRGECVALWWAVKQWRCFLEGVNKFFVISDHLSLKWLRTKQDDVKIQRCANELESFEFAFIHKKGQDHVDADATSRCYATEQEKKAAQQGAAAKENNDVCEEPEEDELVETEPHTYDHILAILAAPVQSRTRVQSLFTAQRADPQLRRLIELKDGGGEAALLTNSRRYKALKRQMDLAILGRDGVLRRWRPAPHVPVCGSLHLRRNVDEH